MRPRIKVLEPELYADDSFEVKHPGDAGVDLRARTSHNLKQGETVRIPLGVAVTVGSEFLYGMVGSRSSTLEKFGLLTQEGKIDSGYTGEIHLIAYAVRDTLIARGDRIAQLLIVRIRRPDWMVVDELDTTVRGAAGFGSTGAA